MKKFDFLNKNFNFVILCLLLCTQLLISMSILIFMCLLLTLISSKKHRTISFLLIVIVYSLKFLRLAFEDEDSQRTSELSENYKFNELVKVNTDDLYVDIINLAKFEKYKVDFTIEGENIESLTDEHGTNISFSKITTVV